MSRKPGSPVLRARGAFWAILHLRCPRCHHGKVFSGAFAMNERCPVCLLRFEREPGYFVGAMYISYVLSSLIVALALLAFVLLLPGVSEVWLYVSISVMLFALVPAIFRYSRVMWITFDRTIDE